MQRSITPTPDQARSRRGFTIVELLVVIAVIGILATISIVSYGAWKKSAATAQVKSDLNGVAAAMESVRTFANAYPATIPTTFTASTGVTLTGGSADGGKTYCVDGASTSDLTIVYYVDSTASDKGAQAGTCATRPNLPAPGIPSYLAIVSSTGTQVNLSWNAASDAANYTAQCASDAAFINGLKESTQSGTSASISGLTMSSSFYCRVKAVNNTGSSAWSASVSITTTNAYGSLAVATSIEGYWSSAPQGFLLEDGSAVSRTTYADLFAVIGVTFGSGDGSTTFNLPDSRGRVGVNLNSSDTEFDTIGEKPGSKTERLTVAQLPAHGHGWGVIQSSALMPSGSYYGIVVPTSAVNVGGDQTHNNIQPSIVKSFAIKYAPIDTTASSPPEATSINGYWASAPSGYLLEDGSAVSRSTYASLFAVVGTTYGSGDGSTTFNLPDSRGRVSVNKNPSDTEFDVMGEKYGEKTHTLTIAEMPSHNHGSTIEASPYLSSSGNYYGFLVKAPPTITGGGQPHSNIQPSIVRRSAIRYAAAVTTGSPIETATSINGYWASAPSGYLLEDGSAVSRSTYASLFAVVGTTYGSGDGSTTFNLPDSRGRVSVNKNPSDTEFDVMGEKYGEKTHTLTIAEMPSHNHGAGAQASSYLVPSGSYYGVAVLASPVNTGGGQPHNNIQPSIVKMFAIKY